MVNYMIESGRAYCTNDRTNDGDAAGNASEMRAR